MWKLCLTFICFTLSVSAQRQQLFENQSCNNSPNWICKKFRECQWASDAIRRGVNPTICSFSGSTPIVCCPATNSPPVTQRPTRPPAPARGSISQRKCAEYAQYVFELVDSPILLQGATKENISTCAIEAETLIVGGVSATSREFPHMALVGYGTDRNRINWACGGSLISENFVLSAAHCSNPSRVGPASWVLLGELDRESDQDDATPMVVKIGQRIDHPSYVAARLYNDITLFRLERRVPLTSYIRPICLPDNRKLPNTALASGWGHTEFAGKGSNDLKKVLLRFVSQPKCQDIYKNAKQLPQGIREDSQVCAGEDGKDTCQGDSGGPLQITLLDPYCMYMQVGITSFGRACGNNFPGVYTRIANYVSWIEENVWPNQ